MWEPYKDVAAEYLYALTPKLHSEKMDTKKRGHYNKKKDWPNQKEHSRPFFLAKVLLFFASVPTQWFRILNKKVSYDQTMWYIKDFSF